VVAHLCVSGGACWSLSGELAFYVSPIEVKLTEDAVNELGLCQVDVTLGIPLDVDPKEVGNSPLDGDLEPSCLHVLHHF